MGATTPIPSETPLRRQGLLDRRNPHPSSPRCSRRPSSFATIRPTEPVKLAAFVRLRGASKLLVNNAEELNTETLLASDYFPIVGAVVEDRLAVIFRTYFCVSGKGGMPPYRATMSGPAL